MILYSVDDHLPILLHARHIIKRVSQSAEQDLGRQIADDQHGRFLKEAPESALATVSEPAPAECPECADGGSNRD